MYYVAIRKLFCYMKFGRVSATPFCNYSLLFVLLLDVFCSTLCNLIEYKIPFPVAVICCIWTIRYYISHDFHEIFLIKLTIVEYNYGYCKNCCWPYQLLLSLNFFSVRYYLQNWMLFTVTTRFSVKVFVIEQILQHMMESLTG